MRIQITLPLVLSCSILLSACSDSLPLAPDESYARPRAPALHVLTVTLRGQPGGTMQGEYAGRTSGSLTAETISMSSTGTTLTFEQRWVLGVPDSVMPLDPVSPGTLHLRGALDLHSGHLLLEGRSEDGNTVSVSARLTADGSTLAIGGELIYLVRAAPR